jgi:cytochrome b6-f complex iron-sulfur subunit
MTGVRPSRRQLLAAASAGAGTAALAGCSGEDPGTSDAGSSASGPTELVALADVPVGGAVSVEGPNGPVIVAQPTAGEAVAYSAICTHQGCTVAPDGDQVRCPCHGSVYEMATGRNVSGPAPEPLPPVTVEVVDGQVTAG